MRTLRVHRPVGHTLLLSLLILFLLFIATEILLRVAPISATLPNSNFGGQHKQLESQFARLDLILAHDGQVNCFLLGDSLVWLGLDPESFQNAFEDVTGNSLQCFNFGVSAMPTAAAEQLADYLVQTYHPLLLIYGVHARDLAVPITDEESSMILDAPWFQYRKGETTLTNWIWAHVAILRNQDYLRALLRLDLTTARNVLGLEYRQLHGFDPKSYALLDVNVPPAPMDPKHREGFRRYWDYKISEENIVALERIAKLNNQDLQVLVVVMPVHPNFTHFFRNGKQDYARFISSVEETVVQTGTPLWVLDSMLTIPDNGWYDYSHLSLQGAEVLSDWLGIQVGNFVQADSSRTTNILAP